MSMYVGDLLLQAINEFTSDEISPKLERAPSKLTLGATTLPLLPRDASDRNRTSPFAFTGNKFEFRAVGSSQSCSRPGMILNSIVADSLHWIADEIEKEIKEKGFGVDIAVNFVVKRTLKNHMHVIFNGNGYSEEWVQEAQRRGLPNLRTTPEAINAFAADKNVAMFERLKIMSKGEVLSAQTVLFENFSKTVAIEADCLYNMGMSFVVPVALEYKQKIAASIDMSSPDQAALLKNFNDNLNKLLSSLNLLKEKKDEAKKFHEEELKEQATYYRTEVREGMDKTRVACDALEVVIDDKMWPFPKYSEMLFMK
jgi:glutamine synthetase